MKAKITSFRIALLLCLTMLVGAVQAQTISGNVKDEFGEAVIGATVIEEGTKNGTVTDFDGNFTLKLTEGKKAIVISYIGMKTQTVDISGKTSVNVVLEDDATTLQDEVVVGGDTMDDIDADCQVTGTFTPTGISTAAMAGQTQNAIYNLQGQRVNKTAKGLYIVNGKKCFVR